MGESPQIEFFPILQSCEKEMERVVWSSSYGKNKWNGEDSHKSEMAVKIILEIYSIISVLQKYIAKWLSERQINRVPEWEIIILNWKE